MSQKSPPFEFFDLFNRIYVNKAQTVPPFYIFRHYATFSERKKIKNFKFFFKKSLLRFLSFRYSADFRRYRLVGIKSERFCVLLRRRRRKKFEESTPIGLSRLHTNFWVISEVNAFFKEEGEAPDFCTLSKIPRFIRSKNIQSTGFFDTIGFPAQCDLSKTLSKFFVKTFSQFSFFFLRFTMNKTFFRVVRSTSMNVF